MHVTLVTSGFVKIVNVQMSFDKAQFVARYQKLKRPRYVIDNREQRQYAQPKPHEYVNDLVEEIYSQHALHSPIV